MLNKEDLKKLFETDDILEESSFIELIDSMYNKIDDEISSNEIVSYNFEMSGRALATIGLLAKSSDAHTTKNPSGLPTTSQGSPGLNNGGTLGYLIRKSGTVTNIRVKMGAMATDVATVNNPCYIRFGLYKQQPTSRALLQNIDVPVTNTSNVGTYNNVGGNNTQLCSLSLNIPLTGNEIIGLEFVNVNNNASFINSIKTLIVTLDVTY